MFEDTVEIGVHLLGALFYTGVSGLLAVIGLFFEYRSYLFVESGESLLALWLGALGLVLLAFSVLVLRDKARSEYGQVVEQLKT